MQDRYYESAHALLSFYAERLVGLYSLVPSSSGLRQLVIRSVELIGYKGFEGVGVERFVQLLNDLHVTIEDMDRKPEWLRILLDTLQSPETVQHLFHWYWELLAELSILKYMVARRWDRLCPADHDVPHRSPGMGKVGVLDRNRVDDIATGRWRDDRRGS